MDGAIHTYKALLVAKGFTQTLWIDYEETFSPIADIRAIRILIAIDAFYDYELWQMDVKTTFLNGYLNEEDVKSYLGRCFAMKDLGEAAYILRIKIYRDRSKRVSCYTDAGYLTDADDMKSQTGYVFILNRGDVDWKSTKQSIFATSFTDGEYNAVFDASKEAIWIRKFILEL
ncbi:retrovirus-related pol polyprotein from transposon TNT 1-94 [Tanacetum coccineum]